MGKYETWVDELKAEFKYEFQSLEGLDLTEVLPLVLSREECLALIDVYSGTGSLDERNKLIIRVFYATGVRIAELAALRFGDVNYDNKTIFVRAGKGGQDRYVCVDSETLSMITEYQGDENLDKKIFTISIRQIRRVVEKAGEIVGIEGKFEAAGRKFSAHSLRHAFSTHCYENGIRIFTLKKLLGHQYLGTTQIYINTSTKYDSMEYERANPFVNIID